MSLKEFTFVWRIDDFSYYWQKTNRVEIRSPEFDVNNVTGTAKWQLVFFDRYFLDDRPIRRNEKPIILLLHRIDNNGPNSITLNIMMSFVKADKSLVHWPEKVFSFYKNQKIRYLEVSADEILSLKRHELLPQDVLIVRCKMWDITKTLNLVERQCFARTLLVVEYMHFVAVVDECDLIPGLKGSVPIKSTSVEQPKFSMNVCLSDDGKLHISIPVEADCIHLCHCKVLVLNNLWNWNKCGEDSEWRKYGEVCEFPLILDFKTLMNKNYVQNGVVTLKCEVTYSTEKEPPKLQAIKYGLHSSEISQQLSLCVKNSPASEVKKASLQSPYTLTEDLVSLYKEGTLCDTNLRAEKKTFPAHKAVLSARSPVFKKMFTTDMSEKTKDYVDIQDINADIVRKFLIFVYTDTVDLVDWQNAKELYFAADKYEIVSLKLECSTFLKLNIRPSNCCELLLLSDMHQDSDLKQFVEEYILTRDQDVFGSDEWRIFMRNHVQLAADTMCLKYARNKK